MRSLICGVFGAAIVTASPRAEDIESANYLLPGCRQFLTLHTTADGFREGLCAGIVYGVAARTIAVRFQSMGNVPESLCVAIPSAATNEQMVRVVVAYIDAHPERMRELFSELAFEALQQAW